MPEFSRLSAALPLLLGLLAAGPARADPIFLDVVPSLSRVTIEATSRLVIDPGDPLDPVEVPVEPPSGAGSTLPGGGTSNGLEAAVGGAILADLTPGAFPQLFFHATHTVLDSLPSGEWAPGPGGVGDPTPADLAFALDGGAAAAVSAEVALRELALVSSLFAFPSETAPGEFTFDVRGTELLVGSGVVDVASDVPGLAGRLALAEESLDPNGGVVGQGVLRDLGAGLFELEVDLAFPLTIGSQDFGLPLPAELVLDVGLHVHATNAVVPEPGALALLCFGLLGLAVSRWSARGRAHACHVLLLVAAGGLASGISCDPPDDPGTFAQLDTCESQSITASAGEAGQAPADSETKTSATPQCGTAANRTATAEATEGDAMVRSHAEIVQGGLQTGGSYKCLLEFESLSSATTTAPILEAGCAIETEESFGYQDSMGGGGLLQFRAGQAALGAAPGSAVGVVEVACTDTATSTPAVVLPLDGAPIQLDVGPGAVGDCRVEVVFEVGHTSDGVSGNVQLADLLYWSVDSSTGLCANDSQCAAGDRCVSGVCLGGGVGAGCINPLDCDPGLLCNGLSQCSAGRVGDACSFDFDCLDEGSYCAAFDCQDGSRGVPCVGGEGHCREDLSLDCAAAPGAAGTCSGGSTFEPCASDDQCAPPLICDLGVCRECRDSSDCDPGESCQAGVCSPFLEPCDTAADCAAGEICLLVDRAGGDPLPEQACVECDGDADCALGRVCSGHRCVDCVSDADCFPAEVCASTGECGLGVSG